MNCQHDKAKPEPTLRYMHTADDGHKWRCTVCDGRFTTAFTTTSICTECKGAGQICTGNSGAEADGYAPILERCESCDGSGTI